MFRILLGDFESLSRPNSTAPKLHPLNDRLDACFQAVLLTEDGSAPSNLFQVSLAADQHLKVLYNARPEEPCARAFEAFIKDSQPRNRFLVSETVHSDEAKAGLYPHGDHRQRINHAFQCYFAALGAALYREQAKAG